MVKCINVVQKVKTNIKLQEVLFFFFLKISGYNLVSVAYAHGC